MSNFHLREFLALTPAGREKVGVAGRTGCGKSTLMMALKRIVEPSSGRILIDGVDIAGVSLADLRSRLALVPQVSGNRHLRLQIRLWMQPVWCQCVRRTVLTLNALLTDQVGVSQRAAKARSRASAWIRAGAFASTDGKRIYKWSSFIAL